MKTAVIKGVSLLLAALLLVSRPGILTGLRDDGGNFFSSPDEQYAELVEYAEKTIRVYGFEGSVLIATDDEVILYAGPRAVTAAGRPVDPYTTYDIASCSKLFTAVCIFQLVEEGRLSLDAPVSGFFPDYEAGRDITVWHLLHMQSGIPDYTNEFRRFWVKVGPEDLDRLMHGLFRDEVSDAEFLENLFAAPLMFAPGTDQSYSNTNYHLLAMIVEQVSGMRFCDYLQLRVFGPCGMAHTTSMVAGNETSVPLCFGDLLEIGMVSETGYDMCPNQERGDGGVHTCMADLWAFDRALFGGKLVGPASLEEMMNFDRDYGCGLFPYGKHAYGHSGGYGSYTSENIVFETEAWGRVYLIASTSSASPEQAPGLQQIITSIPKKLR